jgi:hypothetical protein
MGNIVYKDSGKPVILSNEVTMAGLRNKFNQVTRDAEMGQFMTLKTQVKVLKTPISERYCKVGDTATLDEKNNQIRCGGAWFKFDERWIVEPCNQ